MNKLSIVLQLLASKEETSGSKIIADKIRDLKENDITAEQIAEELFQIYNKAMIDTLLDERLP